MVLLVKNLSGILVACLLSALTVPARAADPVADFTLVDVNANSQRPNAQVSPRDYIFQVSGYYFGHAG